jgi:hypothetical protein
MLVGYAKSNREVANVSNSRNSRDLLAEVKRVTGGTEE